MPSNSKNDSSKNNDSSKTVYSSQSGNTYSVNTNGNTTFNINIKSEETSSSNTENEQIFDFFMFLFLVVIALMVATIVGAYFAAKKVVSAKLDNDAIQTNYEKYTDIFNKVYPDSETTNSSYVTIGSFVSYQEQSGKYCITYTVLTNDGWQSYQQTSPAVYTYEQVSTLVSGQEILVAVNEIPVTNETQTIPLELRFVTYKDDGAYTQNYRKMLIYFALLVGCAVLVVVEIIWIVKIVKSEEEDKRRQEQKRKEKINNEINQLIDTISEKTKAKEEEEVYYCEYCGGKVDKKDKKCSNCGCAIRKPTKHK